MSINKLVSIHTPLTSAKDMLNIDHTKDDPVFLTWAIEAEKEIGSPSAYKRQRKVLEIKGCVAYLPKEAMILDRAIMGNHGCDCEDLFLSTTIPVPSVSMSLDMQGFAVIDMASENESYFSLVKHEIQNNKIVFAKNYDGQSITIQYRGYEVDCDGFMKVGENHVQAIAQYIMYKYCVRSRFSEKPMTPADVQFHYQEWDRMCAHARADDNMLTEADRLEISNILNDPLFGRGLTLGMNNTTRY